MANKLITCPVCGAEMAASAKACPKCGAKNKKPFYKKWWFYVILAVIVIGAVAGGGDSESSGSKSSNASEGAAPPAAEPVSYTYYPVTDLFDALKSNALKAENTYKGQYVEIEGFLGTIDSSGKYIGVGANPDNYTYLLQEVQCYIKTDGQRNQVLEMNKGDPITVRGKIKSVGEVLGYSLDIDSIG